MIKLFLFFLCISSTVFAAGRESGELQEAIDWPPSRVIKIGGLCKRAYDVEWQDEGNITEDGYSLRSIKLHGKKVGVWEETPEAVTIALQGINSNLSSWMINYIWSFKTRMEGRAGVIHSGILDIFSKINREDSFRRAIDFETDGRKDKEFIFAGYGMGGALAIAAAGAFEHENRERLRYNQIKVITFSAPQIVDEDYRKEFINSVGKKNILQFTHYLDVTKTFPFAYRHLGIPIYILPSEQLRDVVYDNLRSLKSLYGTMVAGLLILQFYSDYLHSTLTHKGINEESKNKALVLFTGSLMTAFDTFLIGSRPSIPSDYTLYMSFSDTRETIKTIRAEDSVEEDDLAGRMTIDDAGWVSPFSITRSVFFRFVYDLF